MGRPWKVSPRSWETCMDLFPKWLQERKGIVVYENHMLDSSHAGDRSFMPARFMGEDNQMHDAPEEHRPHGGLPSLRQQKVDHIKLEDFGSVEDALKCFVEDKPVKDHYSDGVCPDCQESIPEEAVEGEECSNCGHVFWKVDHIKLEDFDSVEDALQCFVKDDK